MFIEQYQCIHCAGIAQIEIVKDTEKATEPKIEFCPFCGMSNEYAKEIEGDEMYKGNMYI